jgi:hypothetical protein
MNDATIFSLLAPLTDQLGITQTWLAATALNVMSVTSIARAKYAQVSGFWPTTILVATVTAMMAAAEYYTNPLAIFVSVVVIWGGTTLTMKGGEKVIDLGRKGFDRPPAPLPDGTGT